MYILYGMFIVEEMFILLC